MSYNVTTWKTKKINNLTMPIEALYSSENKNWHPNQPVITDCIKGEVSIECGCGQEIKGILKDGILTITELDMNGEGSGVFLYYIFNPALLRSEGELEAMLIWEGGDSITKLTVKNGILKEEPVEL